MQLLGLGDGGTAWFVLGRFFVALWLCLAASLCLWVYRDARGSDSPAGWAIGVGVLAIPMLPWYLYRRRSLDERHDAGSTFDRLLSTWVLAGLATFVLGIPPVAPRSVQATDLLERHTPRGTAARVRLRRDGRIRVGQATAWTR